MCLLVAKKGSDQQSGNKLTPPSLPVTSPSSFFDTFRGFTPTPRTLCPFYSSPLIPNEPLCRLSSAGADDDRAHGSPRQGWRTCLNSQRGRTCARPLYDSANQDSHLVRTNQGDLQPRAIQSPLPLCIPCSLGSRKAANRRSPCKNYTRVFPN